MSALRLSPRSSAVTMRDPRAATLDFEEFSYVNDQGEFGRIGSESLNILLEYLSEHYQAVSVFETLPYMVIYCADTVSPPSERPFMVAGLVAVWLVQEKDLDPQVTFTLHFMRYAPWIHERESMNEHWIMLEDDLLDDLKPFLIPKAKTLSAIMDQYFPEALAISYINYQITVEFKEGTPEEYKKRLESSPYGIVGTNVPLRYHNGSIHEQEPTRLNHPNPTKFDSQYDDTDYVKTRGCFYPGAMLSSKNNTLISAGIQVQRQQKIGLTADIHCWDEQLESEVNIVHEDYTVKQGDWTEGTVVGSVTERIGSSNIGVAKLDKPFSNQFLNLNGSATRLLHSDNLRTVKEPGKRIYKADKRANVSDEPSALSGPEACIEFVQGVYWTSTLEMSRYPKIREGVRGAAIVRARGDQLVGSSEAWTPPPYCKVDSVTPLKKQHPQEETAGKIAGFMYWSNIQSLYTDRLLCFADVADGLIEDGWEVVPAARKRKAGEANLDNDSGEIIMNYPPEK